MSKMKANSTSNNTKDILVRIKELEQQKERLFELRKEEVFNILQVSGRKHLLLQDEVLSNYAQGAHIYVLDIGRNFAHLANLLDGEIIQVDQGLPLSLNPFVAFKPNMLKDEKFMAFAKALLCIMCGVKEDDTNTVVALEKAILDALVATNYELDITSFAVFLENNQSEVLRRLGVSLSVYTEQGIYGKYFSGAKSAKFNNQFMVFEFEGIKDGQKLQEVILQVILIQIVNEHFLGDSSKKFMTLVDEGWALWQKD